MKKNFFPMALMAIAMGLNACSSDDPVVNAGGGSGQASFADGGYVKMAINMPSVSGGRSANDNFEESDGLLNEFAVKDATLVLFKKGASDAENDAVFHSAYSLPISMTKEGVQITSTTKIVSLVEQDVPSAATDKLFAYVVLNNNGLLTIGTQAGKSAPNPKDLTVNGHKVLFNGAGGSNPTTDIKNFADFRNQVVTGGETKFHSNNGFLMDNAPLSNKPGGTVDPASPTITSLVEITGDKVYRSKAEADASVANEIFVERAVAKVTLEGTKKNLTGEDISVPGETSNTVPYTIEGWALDVTNNSSYLGRNFNSSWSSMHSSDVVAEPGATPDAYRFIGSQALRTKTTTGEGGTTVTTPVANSAFYRTYWAEDPNYSGARAADFTYLKKNEGDSKVKNPIGSDSPLYCMENTFNLANMTTAQITRAIVKVKFFGGATFYTFNGDNTTLYKQTPMEKRIKEAILNNEDVLKALKNVYSGVIADANIDNIDLEATTSGDGDVVLKSFEIKNATGGADKVFTFTDLFAGETESATNNLNTKLGLGTIIQYTGGIAYYPIRIKHFGDDLTPWDKATVTNPKYPYGHPVDEGKYLGRFGVLRNNWYNITVNSIKNVGSAVVPEVDFDKDNKPDEIEQYISVRINVLSWAKRNQSVEL